MFIPDSRVNFRLVELYLLVPFISKIDHCELAAAGSLYLKVWKANEEKDQDEKSDNLQCNTLVRWVAGTNNLYTKCLMFQTLLFL